MDGCPLALFDLRIRGVGKDVFEGSSEGSSEGAWVSAGNGESPKHKNLIRFLVSKDGQVVIPTLHNLTDDTIGFHLSHHDQMVNQVNLLRKYESYSILADQRTGKEMVLALIEKKSLLNGKTSDKDKRRSLTTREDESREQQEGLYWKLQVFPSFGSLDVASPRRWSKTSWRCLSYIVSVERAREEDFPNRDKGRAREAKGKAAEESSEDDEEQGALFGCLGDEDEKAEEDQEDEEDEKVEHHADKKDASQVFTQDESSFARSSLNKEIVGESLACLVKTGKQIEIKCEYVNNISLDYTKESCCHLHVAVSSKLLSSPNVSHDVGESRALIQSYLTEKWQHIICPNPFLADECSICLEEVTDKSKLCTFHPCGHQCTHLLCSASLKHCPQCRAPIVVALQP